MEDHADFRDRGGVLWGTVCGAGRVGVRGLHPPGAKRGALTRSISRGYAFKGNEPAHASAFWQALRHSARVMLEFRARFIGKVSPVHFFWGAPDLAVTRFSGRAANASGRNSEPAGRDHAGGVFA
ncbi:MAG: DUF5996 family protein [Bryobacterales bacterium]